MIFHTFYSFNSCSVKKINREGGCFVLSCNQFTRRSDYPDDYPIDGVTDPNAVLSRGGSCIVSPSGEILAGPNYQGEIILAANIELDDITRYKYDFDVVGHYARPDVFQLHVNESPQTLVVIDDAIPD